MELYYRYAGIGDALFVNTFVYQKGLETGKKILVGTNHPSIFSHNPYAKVLPYKTRDGIKRYIKFWSFLGRKIEPLYLEYGNPGSQHIFDVLQTKTAVATRPVKPFFFLSEVERQTPILAKSPQKIIAVQSTGVTGWTDNKNYYFERYQQIVNELGQEYSILQLGQASDPLLQGVQDYRGKLSFRQVFKLFTEIDLFMGQVGFLMHAAAAMDCRSVIIYGGFEAPWQSGYPLNHNIFSNVECAPCWKVVCPYNKKCMDVISAEQIIKAAKSMIQAKNHNLS